MRQRSSGSGWRVSARQQHAGNGHEHTELEADQPLELAAHLLLKRLELPRHAVKFRLVRRPELLQIRIEVRRLRIDAKFDALEAKFDAKFEALASPQLELWRVLQCCT